MPLVGTLIVLPVKTENTFKGTVAEPETSDVSEHEGSGALSDDVRDRATHKSNGTCPQHSGHGMKSTDPLVTCEFFEVRLCSTTDQIGHEGENLTLAVTKGQLDLAGETFRAGDFAIIPSSMIETARRITSRSDNAQWLEIRIP
jgi:hypothetical protein